MGYWGNGKKIKKMTKITNYKIQITNKLQITNYKLQTMHLPKKRQLPKYNVQNLKGSHGLHQDTFTLQTMAALIKSFCGGGQGGRFFKK
jgi:hypothetical protein